MKKVRFFNPGMSYARHRDEILGEVDRIFTNGDLILRADGEKFEEDLAEFCGKKYAVGLNSGTDALYLALKAVGVKEGDDVIVSAHTFVASVQVIVQLGANPILVDMYEDWRLKITPNTTACIPCHIAGAVLDWEPVEGIHMIDDSCQALGAKGFKGEIQCWSFYPAKILGCFGDGGGITTDNADYARDIKDLGNHWKSDYSKWGINSRLDNVQAVILNVRLKYLPTALARRKEVAQMYIAGIRSIGGLPKDSENRVWQDFIFRTGRRDELYEFLKERGIETMKNEYPFPITKGQAAFNFESETLRLPCNENLTDDEVEYVIKTINEFA
jgi:dTDP-4-amino-4,6-dideoxygalactose transaminase